jgi:hypothetical protein
MAHAVFLAAFVLLVVLAYVWARSAAWLAIALALVIGVVGAFIGFTDNLGLKWTFTGLQWALLASLVVVAASSFLMRGRRSESVRRDVATVFVPMAVLVAALVFVRSLVPAEDGVLAGVSFFFQHTVGEDNAKWLDFTSQLAAGVPIEQSVPLGGPLSLVVAFVATAVATVSQLLYGGVNQVAVAVNAVIYSEYFLVIAAPMALAPYAAARLGGKGSRQRIPAPIVWLGSGVLAMGALLSMKFGHLTFQFVIVTLGLWVAVFLAGTAMPRARLWTSLAMVTTVVVWFPLNALGLIVLAACIVVVVRRLWTGRAEGLRTYGLATVVVAVVTVFMWHPLTSSLSYAVGSTGVSATQVVVGGAARGIAAVVHVPAVILPSFPLFGSNGGTEVTGPILMALIALGILGALWVLQRQVGRSTTDRRVLGRFAPLLLLGGYVVLIAIGDVWITGESPHYGVLKMTFLLALLAIGATLPIAFLQLDPGQAGMTNARWVGLGLVLVALTVDGVLPRAATQIRPQLWSSQGSDRIGHWGLAEVRPVGDQPIDSIPIGCVLVGPGDPVPTVLPIGQETYTCSRLLTGLSGQDAESQAWVDWQRREWTGGTSAWNDVYGYLNDMPDAVKKRSVIVIDYSKNVRGIETIDDLLRRFPPVAATDPAG